MNKNSFLLAQLKIKHYICITKDKKKMEKEFTRYDWEQYKEMLEKYYYTQEEISAVKEIREKYDYMTNDQFRFLFLSGVIKRIVKNKKPRSYYTDGKDVLYLNHHSRKFERVGFFVEEE